MTKEHTQERLKDAFIDALRTELEAAIAMERARDALDDARQKHNDAKLVTESAERKLRFGMDRNLTPRWSREGQE